MQTELGSLFVTVSTDEDGEPFEVFGFLGKGGSFQHGVTELACRLISLHLRSAARLGRRGRLTSARAYRKWRPSGTSWATVSSVAILGLGDGIAHILKEHLKAKHESERRRRKPT